MLHHLRLFLLMIAAAVTLYAQDRTAKPDLPESIPQCTEELFENAEASFQMRRRGTEALARAERDLRGLLRSCLNAPARYQAETQLKVVREELAENNLRIALFYLKKYRDGKGGRSPD